MAVFHKIAPAVTYLMVDGKMRVSAEEFETALERLEQAQDGREDRTAVVATFGGDGQRRGASVRTVAESEWYVVAEHHLTAVVGQRKILTEPLHLCAGELSGLIVSLAAGELYVVEAHEMLVAPVEGIVGGPPAVFPFLSV